MRLLLSLLGTLVQSAHAGISQLGSSNSGVSAMWSSICAVMPCSGGKSTPALIAASVVKFLVDMIGGVAAAVLLYAAIKIIMSQGKDEGISEGKKIAMYALLGVVLAIISDGVISYLISVLQNAAA
ncbi:hypothetical protein HYZ99_03885 [Candidatus Peregrinibacteria bacterium]|nr:hypothetical protein [Candidatus Peregrinibacteria bacterium]